MRRDPDGIASHPMSPFTIMEPQNSWWIEKFCAVQKRRTADFNLKLQNCERARRVTLKLFCQHKGMARPTLSQFLELQNPSFNVPDVQDNRQSPDCEALKLRKGRSG